MHYIDGASGRDPSGPAPRSGDWATFVAGDTVRCPECRRALAVAHGRVVVRVRLERPTEPLRGLRVRCQRCGVYLEVQVTTTDQAEAA